MINKTAAWILSADEDAARSAAPALGVRLLPAPDIRLFGQDRSETFVGPGERRHPPAADPYHPHPLMVDGKIIGAWGRKGGDIQARVTRPLSDDVRAALETEAHSMPIPGRHPQVTVDLITTI